ncbi:uncharacterized protein [Haliotis asinina]|uniref:uncharacterized protein n=1 Tax=Haliotis asinina TaxID=109174 RepID=UPI0035327406
MKQPKTLNDAVSFARLARSILPQGKQDQGVSTAIDTLREQIAALSAKLTPSPRVNTFQYQQDRRSKSASPPNRYPSGPPQPPHPQFWQQSSPEPYYQRRQQPLPQRNNFRQGRNMGRNQQCYRCGATRTLRRPVWVLFTLMALVSIQLQVASVHTELRLPWGVVFVHTSRIDIAQNKWVHVFKYQMPDLVGMGNRPNYQNLCGEYSLLALLDFLEREFAFPACHFIRHIDTTFPLNHTFIGHLVDNTRRGYQRWSHQSSCVFCRKSIPFVAGPTFNILPLPCCYATIHRGCADRFRALSSVPGDIPYIYCPDCGTPYLNGRVVLTHIVRSMPPLRLRCLTQHQLAPRPASAPPLISSPSEPTISPLSPSNLSLIHPPRSPRHHEDSSDGGWLSSGSDEPTRRSNLPAQPNSPAVSSESESYLDYPHVSRAA